jgi:hypothetical protein
LLRVFLKGLKLGTLLLPVSLFFSKKMESFLPPFNPTFSFKGPLFAVFFLKKTNGPVPPKCRDLRNKQTEKLRSAVMHIIDEHKKSLLL